MSIKKIFAYVFGIFALASIIGAVWLHEDWGWLKFGLTGVIFACVAIVLAASEDVHKRP